MDRARAVWPRVIEVSQPAAPTTCEPTEPGLMNGILPFSFLPMKNYCCCLWPRPEGGKTGVARLTVSTYHRVILPLSLTLSLSYPLSRSRPCRWPPILDAPRMVHRVPVLWCRYWRWWWWRPAEKPAGTVSLLHGVPLSSHTRRAAFSSDPCACLARI